MDRLAMARAARSRRVREALEFERERETMLVEELEDILAEGAGPEIDERALAGMDLESVIIVRELLTPPPLPEAVDDDFGGVNLEDDPDPAVAREEEIARLQEVIEDCRRRQRAFETYLGALSDETTGRRSHGDVG